MRRMSDAPVHRPEGHRLCELDRRTGGGDDHVRLRRRRDQDRAARRRRSLARPQPSGANNDYYWQLTSRNKRSLALDLKHEAGRAVLYRLVAEADVFVTNFPLPVRDRLKLAPAHLLPLNPRLIYASFTAYGEAGEEAAKTGFDSTAYWARTGLMDAVRADVDTPPARSAPGMGDHPERHRPLRRDRHRTVSPGEDRAGRRGAVVAVAEWPLGQRLLRADAPVRRTRAASSDPRAGAERTRQPLPLSRRPLVHHGAVQRATAVAAVAERDRPRRPDATIRASPRRRRASRTPRRWLPNWTRCSPRATWRNGGRSSMASA